MKADSPKPSEDEGALSPAREPLESHHSQSSASVNGQVRDKRLPLAERPRPQLPPRTEVQPQRGWRHTFSSLKSRDYLVLWLGMMAMMGGMQMQMLARGYLVYDLTGSASLLGIVSAGSAVPMLVLALFGGAIADRFDRKRLIQIGQITPQVVGPDKIGNAMAMNAAGMSAMTLLAPAMAGGLYALAGSCQRVLRYHSPQCSGGDHDHAHQTDKRLSAIP